MKHVFLCEGNIELILGATQAHRSKWQNLWSQNVISGGVQEQWIPVNSNCTHCQVVTGRFATAWR